MGNHALRPLLVIACLTGAVLVARTLIVPRDFGIGANGYIYGWHRKGNEAEWKAFPPKYKTSEYCKDCHADNYASIHQSPHAVIGCQNCHGPARDHPTQPPKLEINRDRSLCLRCHYALPYAASGRAHIPGIDPAVHNPGTACVTCHNPHKPNLGGAK